MGLNRGDIILVDFDPARSGEANKTRPAILITNNQANLYGPCVIVVPLSSNIERIYLFQLYLPLDQTGLTKDSKAQVELTRSVSKSRLGKRVGQVSEGLLEQLGERLKMHMGLN